MDERIHKIRMRMWKAYLALLVIFTVLYMVRIKFLLFHLNILMWDAITICIYLFLKLCVWTSQKDSESEGIIVVAVLAAVLFFFFMMFMGLSSNGALEMYVEGTEPQTHRTFVVEYRKNMLGKGKAKLYERFGPVIIPCDTEEYVGDIFSPDSKHVYISDDGENIIVGFFFLEPVFSVPAE